MGYWQMRENGLSLRRRKKQTSSKSGDFQRRSSWCGLHVCTIQINGESLTTEKPKTAVFCIEFCQANLVNLNNTGQDQHEQAYLPSFAQVYRQTLLTPGNMLNFPITFISYYFLFREYYRPLTWHRSNLGLKG
jgi:hypothetical protein